MPIPSNKHYEPGDGVLSTEQLNAVIDAVRGLSAMGGGGPGLTVGFDGGVFNAVTDPKREPMWARITGEGAGVTAPNTHGYYSWREIRLRGDGTFGDVDDRIARVGGISGPRPDPARDINFKTAVPIGLPVLLLPMPPSVGGAAGNWMFITPDLVQVVRFGAGARSPWGDYDGWVQRFDGSNFIDAENVWLTVP